MKEFELQKELNHPNIVKVEEMISMELDYEVYIIMEYCEGTTLLSMIHKRESIPENELKIYIAQVLCGLQYMHLQGICHRDIKPDNIMVQKDGSVKIIDFSVAKRYKVTPTSPHSVMTKRGRRNSDIKFQDISRIGLMLTNTGTNDYKAPEIILGAPYNYNVDMWSLGVTVYYALTGVKPFASEYLDELNQAIANADFKFKKS